jgi:release factor glutamine methyltransferase
VTEHVSSDRVIHVLNDATQILAAAGCETPHLDAEVLLAHILDRDRVWLYAYSEHTLSPAQLSVYQSLVSRRASREPVAYLIGHREFYGLDFVVTPDVLIPRPETELLVERAIQWARTSSYSGVIADVGTGSGAIAVSLALHLPRAYVVATDTSPAVLSVACCNAARHGVANRVFLIQADLLRPLRRFTPHKGVAPLVGSLSLIVANPPYLTQAEMAAAPPEVARWEPRPALDGGPDGLAVIHRLLAMASDRLAAGGALLVEIGAHQAVDVLGLASRYFPQAALEIARDYAGRDRLLIVQYAQ